MFDPDIMDASREEAAHFLRCAGLGWPESEPAELRAAVLDIAEFRSADPVSEPVRARYESARLWLKHIAAGRLPLPIDTPVAVAVEDADHG